MPGIKAKTGNVAGEGQLQAMHRGVSGAFGVQNVSDHGAQFCTVS